ncbi:UDP-N-acetylglucosamine-N-acetylmuramylpentapeptide N-acetylglucosamine transferase [Balneicella halophila]|uniref:UDP-N-acetylglucosamine--N-acetylmuramyl-(pentapeptide) pyrophosphoryl-undecaprenol N-acetylglucosamine transferase n=1 Tax=Balneicella halophila TaxID=1537566 RepID=A0A7L4UQR8_BALHA|nr:undecaprenyldiphospho-muramoylpentapeptide beta-N-acetylglucosaminyltransferase [Balneicella halophila]PVX50942.1 UDP-N-acetylglucosamine-N-acetylmuramylpentapeptide N-acetylglucosamine transferase [Balneicella halophila]
MREPKIIISGGGTGGHIFPAVAIANALREALPDAQILFVGAEGKMEMERVPKAEYDIVGLPIRGFQRSKPVTLPITLFKLLKSLRMARKLLKKENPAVVVGVGGYASAAVLHQAAKMKIPTLIQEQNSYPGITNKLLANKAKKICVAYDNMERFFPKEKLFFLGNPIRQDLLDKNIDKVEAFKYYGLDSTKKTVLVVGGSLGARTLNESLKRNLDFLGKQNFQIIWQSGAYYYEQLKGQINDTCPSNVHLFKFLDRMDWAYSVADIVVSRAGALTISELSVLGKSTILVPSPNVTEDHQTKNAMALVKKEATILVKDEDAEQNLVPKVIQLMKAEERRKQLATQILYFAKPNAANDIANEVIKLMK